MNNTRADIADSIKEELEPARTLINHNKTFWFCYISLAPIAIDLYPWTRDDVLFTFSQFEDHFTEDISNILRSIYEKHLGRNIPGN